MEIERFGPNEGPEEISYGDSRGINFGDIEQAPAKREGTSVSKVVGEGRDPEVARKVIEHMDWRFGHQKFQALEGREKQKSPEETEIVRYANEVTNVLLKRLGVAEFDISPENLHLIGDDIWDEDKADAFYETGAQAAAVRAKYLSKTHLLALSAHELLHFKSVNAVRAEDKGERLSVYRCGYRITTRDGKDMFRWLNEAVTEELTKQLVKTSQSGQLFRDELQQTEEAEKYSGRSKNDIRRDDNGKAFFTDDLYYARYEGMKNGQLRFSGERFVYEGERKILHTLIAKLYDRNRDQFKNEDELFERFAKGMFTGTEPIGGLIEKTFGKGTFKKLGELDNEELENFVDGLGEPATAPDGPKPEASESTPASIDPTKPDGETPDDTVQEPAPQDAPVEEEAREGEGKPVRESIGTVRQLLDSWAEEYKNAGDRKRKQELAYRIVQMNLALRASSLDARLVKICEAEPGVLGFYSPSTKEIFITLQGLRLPAKHYQGILVHESTHAGKMTGRRVSDEGLAQHHTERKTPGSLRTYTHEQEKAKDAFDNVGMDEAIEKYDFEQPTELVALYLETELDDLWEESLRRAAEAKPVAATQRDRTHLISELLYGHGDEIEKRFEDGAPRLYENLKARGFDFRKEQESILMQLYQRDIAGIELG
jgi:hypothetical protein